MEEVEVVLDVIVSVKIIEVPDWSYCHDMIKQ